MALAVTVPLCNGTRTDGQVCARPGAYRQEDGRLRCAYHAEEGSERIERNYERETRTTTGVPRPKALPRHHYARAEVFADAGRYPTPAGVERPTRRADCLDGPRPCPWVGCRYHLYADVKTSGSLLLNHPHLEVEEMAETCALDVAGIGGHTLEAIGEIMNLTRERVRQLESLALRKLRRQVWEDDE